VSTQGLSVAVDVVMCIDVTASMHPLIDMVKANARRFHGDLVDACVKNDRIVSRLRVRVIGFRDLAYNKEKPRDSTHPHNGDAVFEESPFFELPRQQGDLAAFLDGLDAAGGGDEPESGLEAIALALRSDWTHEGERQRHVVVLWTDASAHSIESRVPYRPAAYGDLPASLDELTEMWESGQGVTRLRGNARRMVLYAPPEEPWMGLVEQWYLVMHYPEKAGQGLADQDYGEILNGIAKTI
jgi:hypothetical protein